jgi:putative ABC transport system ATP-binding protein
MLHFPDIQLGNSENCLILGESGCGKTTLLHLLAGLRTPSQGEVLFDNTSLTPLSTSDRDRFRGKNIGVIFQSSAFISSLSVLENLMMPLMLSGQIQDENRAKELLSIVHLDHKIQKPINELSVGEQQRVSIIRSIIHGPKWVLADEPTSALDNKNAESVIELLTTITQANNASLIVVTHDHRWNNAISHAIRL